jgi:hypothetical protein
MNSIEFKALVNRRAEGLADSVFAEFMGTTALGGHLAVLLGRRQPELRYKQPPGVLVQVTTAHQDQGYEASTLFVPDQLNGEGNEGTIRHGDYVRHAGALVRFAFEASDAGVVMTCDIVPANVHAKNGRLLGCEV